MAPSTAEDKRPILITWQPDIVTEVNYLNMMAANGLLSINAPFTTASDLAIMNDAVRAVQKNIEMRISQEKSTDWLRTLMTQFINTQPQWNEVSESPSNDHLQGGALTEVQTVIATIIKDLHPDVVNSLAPTQAQLEEAFAVYNADMNRVDKQYTQYNMPSAYAMLLTNKDTIPRVYYGDLYTDDGEYMGTQTPYYDAIVNLLQSRVKYVADSNGDLIFTASEIHGYSNVQVSGFLSVWAPKDATDDQDVRTAASESTSNDGNTLHSNAALDSNLIYEGFSNFQSTPQSESEFANVKIAANVNLFKSWGVTSFQMAPQYRSSTDTSFLTLLFKWLCLTDRYDLI
ncbi:hypothetical protein Pfo_031496 [Paulownia fortunei]|nr:hypothetical protein Pfo_031496 [Paulownia fortunei]